MTPGTASLVVAATAALAACGGGSTGASSSQTLASPTPTPTATVLPSPPITAVQASRFLAQATNGATLAEIDRLAPMGINNWLTEQFAMPRSTTHSTWLAAQQYDTVELRKSAGMVGWDASIWRQLISAPDQLRQRVGLALLDIVVVGIDGLDLPWTQVAMGKYMDLLLDHSFGNFRSLLYAITTSTAMGSFLTYIGSRKGDGTGRQPDENYARELLQLFTIGLVNLNMDGSVIRDGNGKAVETYTQNDISQLARVFTGFGLSSTDTSTTDIVRQPMIMASRFNDAASIEFLGGTVSGGGLNAVNAALDIIFAHPNVPVFISRQLIQRLVTSNPSPAYISRVATVFKSNSAGVRGDMKSVIRAILTDEEARSDQMLGTAYSGKLRDPVQRFANWARAFNATSPNGTWKVGNLADQQDGLGESPGRSPSVFNFFRPNYCPPQTQLARSAMVAPEFQITNELSVVGYANFMAAAVESGVGGGELVPDYGPYLQWATDTVGLVGRINLVLTAGQLSARALSCIVSAVDSIPTDTDANLARRVRVAALLTLVSPDYLTLK